MDSKAPLERLISEGSEFDGDSYFAIKVRYHGNRSKIMVDVLEVTGHRTSMARARKLACNHAMGAGIVSMDYSLISDFRFDRKATNLDGSKTVVHIRRTCFAFAGVN